MSSYIPLSKTDHSHTGWLKSGSFRHAAKDMLVPVLLDELAHILPTMPLVVKKVPSEGGKFQLHALQSLAEGKNYYVLPDGRWLGGYIPSAYRAYPFKILPAPQTGNPALHFHRDSGVIAEKTDPDVQAFFTDDGRLSPIMENILNFLQQCEQGRTITQTAVDALVLHELLTPWEIKTSLEGKKNLIREDLYKIDQEVLRRLQPAALQYLQQKNALAVAYAQIFSQPRISGLVQLYHVHRELEKTNTVSKVPDINQLFGSNFDDLINFDD